MSCRGVFWRRLKGIFQQRMRWDEMRERKKLISRVIECGDVETVACGGGRERYRMLWQQQSQAKRKCNLISKIEQIQHHELVFKLQKVLNFAWCVFVCCDSSSLACYRVPKGVTRWTRNIIEVRLVRNFLILEKNFVSQNVFDAILLVCGCILEISRVGTFGINLSFVVLGRDV